MQYGNVQGIKKKISRIVQGSIMLNRSNKEAGFDLLDAAWQAGITTYDSAHGYGGGEVDRMLGLWMEERGNRDEIVIIGKGAHLNQDRNRVTPYDIASDMADSLVRLRSDYIDLYLLHRDDPAVPVGPIVEALNEHHAAGRIHAFGGSNWTPERLAEANEYADKRGLVPFAASSPNFSLADQIAEPWKDCLSIAGSGPSCCPRLVCRARHAAFYLVERGPRLLLGQSHPRQRRGNARPIRRYHAQIVLLRRQLQAARPRVGTS